MISPNKQFCARVGLIAGVAIGVFTQINGANAQLVRCDPYANGWFTPDGVPCTPIPSGPAYGGGGPVYGGGGPVYGGGGPVYGGGGPVYGGGGPAGPSPAGGGPMVPAQRNPPMAVQEQARRPPYSR